MVCDNIGCTGGLKFATMHRHPEEASNPPKQKRWFQKILTTVLTWESMRIFFKFFKSLEKTTICRENVIIYSISWYKGDQNDVERFPNLLLFAVEY